MGLAGHVTWHTLQIGLRCIWDQPDRCDILDGLNEEPALVFLEFRPVDMETYYDVTLRAFRELIESTDTKRRNSRQTLSRVCGPEVFRVVIDRLFYSMASKGHRKWIWSCAFI
jgi:hypothetical protein